uniref:Uncharacterized protein n=1 Tax=Cyclophora tenuis TaxID=216820 RepID=A0A7S1CX43_CYCTE
MIVYEHAKEEMKIWNALYKDRPCPYKQSSCEKQEGYFMSRAQHLGTRPVLVMPYGYTIAGVDNRWQYIVAIRDLFVTFAKQGFVYQNVRWAHVLLDSSGSVFLCSDESFYELEVNTTESTEDVKERAINKELVGLMRFASDEEPERWDERVIVRDTLTWLTEDSSDEVVRLVDGTEVLEQFFGGWKEESVQECIDFVLSDGGKSHKAEAALWMLWYYKTRQAKRRCLGSDSTAPTKLGKPNVEEP